MEFRKLSIEGAYVITPKVFEDNRGVFRRHFCKQEYESHGLDVNVNQGNISENPYAYTLRGFHFQKGEHGEAKTISCLTGSIYNVIVDIRKYSRTYKNWVKVEISSINRKSIYVPSGCANAYLTTRENTIVHYYMSNEYKSDSYMGFNYRDKTFGFEWPHSPSRISEKDNNLPDFEDIENEIR